MTALRRTLYVFVLISRLFFLERLEATEVQWLSVTIDIPNKQNHIQNSKLKVTQLLNTCRTYDM
jgi:hypothetical protein